MRHPFLRTLAGQGRDPNFKNTVLLLHGDGTNGAQNNTFVDGSSNNFTITRNGNTTQGSFSPYGDNWSNYFDGNGDYLSLSTQAVLNVGTGNFTVECFLFFPAVSRTYSRAMVFGPTEATFSTGLQIRLIGATQGAGGIDIILNNTTVISYTTTVAANTWNHIALVREGTGSNQLKLYINGTNVASGTTAASLGTPSYNIGRLQANNATFDDYYEGYISNLRVVTSAVYTANFTPSTTPLTAITNTSLLTCQSNRFRDNSTNAFAITRNGDVSVQRFSPFAPSAAYSTSAIGGSGYFDGTGDTLTTDATTAFDFANNNFTIEAWIYTTSFATGQGICANQDNGGVSTLDGWVFGLNTDASISFQDWTNTTTVLNLTSSANVIRLNNWHHVVVEKRGTGTNQIQVFVDGVAVATGTRNANIPASTSNQPLTIGNWRYSPDTNREFTGYIADLRIVNSAVYNGTVTVPTAPLTAVTNTSLLCNFTNAGIYDNAMMNDLETVGNAQISTTQKKYGTGALYFDGTGDWLIAPSTPNCSFDTGDFTIEGWIYPTVTTGTDRVIWETRNTASDSGLVLFIDTNGKLSTYTSGAIRLTSTNAVTANSWQHIALVRSSGTLAFYIGGTQNGTLSYSTAITCPGSVRIAVRQDNAQPFTGYIDDLRITKGVARYTATFTPPAAPLADF